MDPSDFARTLRRTAGVLLAAVLVFSASGSAAVEIARWTFDDGTANDSIGSYDLGSVGGGPTIAGGLAVFDGSEASPSYLETSGYGGSPNWTFDIRLQSTAPFDQGTYQGIFSNNSSSTAANSWQLESFNGVYQMRTSTGVYSIGTPTGGWDSIVIRKIGGNDGDVWYNGLQVVSSFGSNPGGLQNFRLGTNRNSNNFAAFSLDHVRVFDSVESVAAVPEPGAALLVGLGLLGLRLFGETGRVPERGRLAPRGQP